MLHELNVWAMAGGASASSCLEVQAHLVREALGPWWLVMLLWKQRSSRLDVNLGGVLRLEWIRACVRIVNVCIPLITPFNFWIALVNSCTKCIDRSKEAQLRKLIVPLMQPFTHSA